MPKCVYCKCDYSFPRGLTLVRKDGTINHLCSSKCHKNMLMKRRKVRWILKKVKDKVTPESKVSEKPVKKEESQKDDSRKQEPKVTKKEEKVKDKKK